MLFPLFDALQVQYDADLGFMRFQWREPAGHYLRAVQASGRNLRPALAHGRDLVVAHRPAYVLVDFEGLPPISLADELWMTANWLPQVAQPLRGVALVLRHEHLHNQMMAESLLGAGRHLLPFQIQVFENVAPALDWLVQGDEATAARLQQEWDSLPPPRPPNAANLTAPARGGAGFGSGE